MWEVVDSVEEPGGDNRNEDHANASGAMAWVLDGASALSQPLGSNALTPARWLVDRLDDELASQAGERAGLEKIVAMAIQEVAREKPRPWDSTDIPPSAALGVVRRVGARCEFLVLADVSVILATDAGAFEFTDRRVDRGNAHAYQLMVDLLAQGCSAAAARAEFLPLLLANRRDNMNREGDHGYWVASFDERAVLHALTGTLDGVNEVILATDGFMRALRPYGCISDVEELFDGRSLGEVRDEVRAIERTDPDTMAFPRWTVSDDICAQRLRWVEQ